MKISQHGITLIKSFETLRLKRYICPAGYPTIGYGHVIKDHENFTEITSAKAEELLLADIRVFERCLLRLTYVELKQNQFDALMSLVFNIGTAAYQRSTLRCRLNRGEDMVEISHEFGRWIYIHGKKSRGLIKRRAVESDLFLRN